MVRAGRLVTAVCLLRKMISSTTSPVASSHRLSKSSSSTIPLSCSSNLTSPFTLLLIPFTKGFYKKQFEFRKVYELVTRNGGEVLEVEISTWKDTPGFQFPMAKSAVAGPYDAGSVVVATTNITIFYSMPVEYVIWVQWWWKWEFDD